MAVGTVCVVSRCVPRGWREGPGVAQHSTCCQCLGFWPASSGLLLVKSQPASCQERSVGRVLLAGCKPVGFDSPKPDRNAENTRGQECKCGCPSSAPPAKPHRQEGGDEERLVADLTQEDEAEGGKEAAATQGPVHEVHLRVRVVCVGTCMSSFVNVCVHIVCSTKGSASGWGVFRNVGV